MSVDWQQLFNDEQVDCQEAITELAHAVGIDPEKWDHDSCPNNADIIREIAKMILDKPEVTLPGCIMHQTAPEFIYLNVAERMEDCQDEPFPKFSHSEEVTWSEEPALNGVVKYQKVPTWQPIETAPRTGFHILLGAPGKATEEGYWDHDAEDWECYFTPTHWQPLPGPPEVY